MALGMAMQHFVHTSRAADETDAADDAGSDGAEHVSHA
jgi:hypothetical protein